MATLTARITAELLDEIDSIAAELERPRNWVIQEAIREYVGRHRLEYRRWQETQEAIHAAERCKVVSAEEVFAWLDSWGQEGAPEE